MTSLTNLSRIIRNLRNLLSQHIQIRPISLVRIRMINTRTPRQNIRLLRSNLTKRTLPTKTIVRPRMRLNNRRSILTTTMLNSHTTRSLLKTTMNMSINNIPRNSTRLSHLNRRQLTIHLNRQPNQRPPKQITMTRTSRHSPTSLRTKTTRTYMLRNSSFHILIPSGTHKPKQGDLYH